jgi:hypothetical protein
MQIILLLNALQIIALKLLLKVIHLQTEISHNDPLSKNKSYSSNKKLNIETARIQHKMTQFSGKHKIGFLTNLKFLLSLLAMCLNKGSSCLLKLLGDPAI